MKFFNNDRFSCPGDPIHIIYSPVVDSDGSVHLVESGKENSDDIIQSFADSCDLNVIIQRFLNGDLTALNKTVGTYGDFTGMPKTYAEALQMKIDSERLFDSLPVEYKRKFDNDSNKFFVQAGSKEWLEIMEPLMNPKNAIVNPPDSSANLDDFVIEKEGDKN